MPTSVAPETAHAPSANHISGVLSNSTPTWKGASTGFRSSRNAARCAIASRTSRYVHDSLLEAQRGRVAPDVRPEQVGDGGRRGHRGQFGTRSRVGYQLPPPPPPPPPPEKPPPLKPLLLDDDGWLA